jgi:inner membrane protein involved in colicin E2 resistance
MIITLRARIFIIVSLAVFVILAISIALIVLKKKSAEPVDEATPINENIIDENNFPAQITTPPTQIPIGATVKQPTDEEMMKNTAKQTAKIFIERYGTYSTDNDNENIYSVQSIVSPSLWNDISRHIDAVYDGEFVGVTTKVIAIDVVEFSSDKAKVDMSVQRVITKGTTTEKISEKTFVRLVKIQDAWLVDSFE